MKYDIHGEWIEPKSPTHVGRVLIPLGPAKSAPRIGFHWYAGVWLKNEHVFRSYQFGVSYGRLGKDFTLRWTPVIKTPIKIIE